VVNNEEVSLTVNKERQQRSVEFKEATVKRMEAGEQIAKLSRELKVKRSLLYRWRNAYRNEGTAGFRPIGRSGPSEDKQAERSEARIRDLERKIGRQAMMIDFFRRAFKRVEGLRQRNKPNGVTASMEKSKP
jgi:transposase